MKRLWFAVILLAVVFTATLFNSFYLKNLTTDLMDRLTQAEVRAEQGDWSETQTLTDEALQTWQDKERYLDTLLRQSDTDLVYIGFREVNELIAYKENAEYSAANARLVAQLKLLYEMEQFTVRNIL